MILSYRQDGGHLIVKGRAARTGYQTYQHGDEYRDASEVFAPESLASWVGIPVLVGHVNIDTPAEASARAVGYVRSVDRADEGEVSYILSTMVIVDASTILQIRDGSLIELSAGYSADIDETMGATPWQRDIRVNHLALLPLDGARCGSACALLL